MKFCGWQIGAVISLFLKAFMASYAISILRITLVYLLILTHSKLTSSNINLEKCHVFNLLDKALFQGFGFCNCNKLKVHSIMKSCKNEI